MTKTESQSKKILKSNLKFVANTARALEKIRKDNSKPMKVLKDHQICYGTTTPLCGQPLGGKGLIKETVMITCPECLQIIDETK